MDDKEKDYFKTIVEHSEDFLFVLTPDFKFEYLNQAMESFLGYEKDELIGKSALKIIEPEDHPLAKFTFNKFLQNYPTKELDIRLLKKSKIRVPILVRAKKLFNTDKKIIKIIASGRRQTSALIAYIEKYKNLNFEKKILANIPGVIWTCDRSLKTHYITPTSYEILGFNPDIIIQNPNFWKEQIIEEDYSKVIKAWNNLFLNQKPYSVEYRFKKQNGSIIWINDKSFGFYKKGNLRLADGILNDITEFKKIQQLLAQSQKMEALGRFAGGISHDFNNLLTIINGFSDMLLIEGLSSTEIFDFANEIKNAAKKAAKMTQEILSFSRKEANDPNSINLNEIILKSKNILKSIVGDTILLEFSLEDEIWPIWADSNQIDQIILNLTLNAKDAMNHGGKLEFSTKNIILKEPIQGHSSQIPIGDYIQFKIADSGKGMNNEQLLHVFEPFYTTKAKGKGTGLGLSIVYGLVNQNKAYITLKSKKQSGTTFNIYFTRFKGKFSLSEVKPTPKNILNLSHISILLVEDNDGIRKFIKTGLNKVGISVSTVTNGIQALEYLTSNILRPDLVISDIVMPELDGYSLSRIIREEWPEIDILLMSGYPEDFLQHKDKLKDKIEFIPKPIDLLVLIEKIQKFIYP